MAGFRKHATWGPVPYLLFASLAFGLSAGWHASRPDSLPVPLVPETLRQALICLALAFIASLFPDTDIKSKSQKLIYRMLFIVDAVLVLRMQYEWAAVLGLFAMFPLLGKHRGWTHSRLTMLLLPAPFLAYPMAQSGAPSDFTGLPYYLAAVIGYATHLALDGILFPSKQRHKH